MTQDEYTAHHEAAHYVLSRHLDGTTYQTAISIKPKGNTLGSVSTEFPSDIEGYLVSLLGGYYADLKLGQNPEKAKLMACGDFDSFEEFSQHYDGDSQHLHNLTKQKLDEHWAEIKELAKLLLDQQTVNVDAVEIFLDCFNNREPFTDFTLHQFPFMAAYDFSE